MAWVETWDEYAQRIRLTTGNYRFGRTEEELVEIDRLDAEFHQGIRDSAGICEEFPAGEFAIPGFNC